MAREDTMDDKSLMNLFAGIVFTLFVMFLVNHLRNRRRRAAGIPNPIGDGDITLKTPATPASQYSGGKQPHPDRLPRHPPSAKKTVSFIAKVAVALLIGALGVGYVLMRFQKPSDPCSACRPDEKTIGIDFPLSDGRITWNWSGPCVGAETCGKCRVKPQSCTTDNDTVFALKCACVNQ